MKSSDFRFLGWIVDRILHVVQCDSAIGSLELIVAELRDAFVGAVLCPEIEDSSPVLLDYQSYPNCDAGIANTYI